MRILHVIPGIAPRYGGPSTAIGPMCAALNRVPGITAEIATTDADGAGGRIEPNSLPAGVETHLFRRTWSERWKYSVELGRWLRRHVADYDVVHIHALWSYSSSAAGAAARHAGVPYFQRPAGMLSGYTLNRRAWSKRLSWSLFERRLVAGAAGFHATSNDEAKEITAAWPAARTFVIPHGVDDGAWETPPGPELLRRRCGSPSSDLPILLFLSRLHPKKGITDLLLPAFARLKGAALLAIAGGPDASAPGYRAEIEKKIVHLGLKNRVILLGPASANVRWQFFDGAAVFVLPSHSENFGIVVVEAMARGCPVVVTDQVHACEHVAAAGAGRVVPLEPVALAAAMDELLADASLRADMGRQGKAYVKAQLGWDRVANDVLAMYRRCRADSTR